MSFTLSPLIRNIARPAYLSKPALTFTSRLHPIAASRRWNSNSTQTQSQSEPIEPKQQPPINPHRNFYKEFGPPVAKVFLMAVFTYQFIYWLWLKLDMDEIVAGREAEVKALEVRLEEVMKEKEKKG